MPDVFNPGQESVAQTASPNISTEAVRYDSNSGVTALLNSLGSQSTQGAAADLNAQLVAQKAQAQQMKVAGYTQEFMDNNKAGGPVSQAQIKAVHPELVPVIAAQIAESIGKIQGGKDAAAMVAQIDGDNTLKYDPGARAAAVADYKNKAFSTIPAGNEFYAAGLAQGTNNAFESSEPKWVAETAIYHGQVQKQAYGDEIAATLTQPGAQAAMLQSDSNWAQKSSLNNVERNATAVDAVMKFAQMTHNSAYLDQIPQQFLNSDSKEAVQAMRGTIYNYQFAASEHQHTLMLQQRADQTHQTNIETLQDLSAGKPLSLSDPKYTGNPDAYDYATKAMLQPTVSPAASMAVRSQIENNITTGGMAGAKMPTLDDLLKQIGTMQGINPDDKVALLKAAPDLLKGTVLMNAPDVRQNYTDHVESGLKLLGSSLNSRMQAMLAGKNLMSVASQMYQGEIQRGYTAYYGSHGNNWPVDADARAIDTQAVQVTNAMIERETSVKALAQWHPDAPAATPHAAPAAGSTAPTPAAPSAAVPSAVKQSTLQASIAAEIARRAAQQKK